MILSSLYTAFYTFGYIVPKPPGIPAFMRVVLFYGAPVLLRNGHLIPSRQSDFLGDRILSLPL